MNPSYVLEDGQLINTWKAVYLGAMSFRRELAKALLAEVISEVAASEGRKLRRSARRSSPGWGRDVRRSLARTSDDVADNPEPVVKVIEAWWDQPRRRNEYRSADWQA